MIDIDEPSPIAVSAVSAAEQLDRVLTIVNGYRTLTRAGGPACCDRLMRLMQRDIRNAIVIKPLEDQHG